MPDLGDVPVVASLRELPDDVHTLTIYLAPHNSEPLAGDLEKVQLERVIFNPGSESSVLAERFEARGVKVVEACTLVLLASGRFEAD